MSSAPMSSVPFNAPDMKQEILDHEEMGFNENQSVGPDLKRQFDKSCIDHMEEEEVEEDDEQELEKELKQEYEQQVQEQEADDGMREGMDEGDISNVANYSGTPEQYDDDQLSNSDRESNLMPTEDYNDPTPINNNINANQLAGPFVNKDGIWVLPIDKNYCTLEEIRRGQVINKKPPNECPVFDCDKKINEKRAEPMPGTISSGLRTHVLFVHYGRPKLNKKRKLGWTPAKRRNQLSPKKHIDILSSHSSPSTSKQDYDSNPIHTSSNISASLNLIQRGLNNPRLSTKSLLTKKPKQQPTTKQALQMSQSLQSLMQATGNVNIQSQPHQKLKTQDINQVQKNYNSTTSSLFSILAGIAPPQGPSTTKKTSPSTTTINISQCSRNSNANNRPVNSSLLSLLNEKISGNVANSLQNQLKKSLNVDTIAKSACSTPRQTVSNAANSYYLGNNETGFNNSSSILSNLCSGNGDSRSTYDNSMPLNQFIESIAAKSGSNIGPSGISEAKKIIEKFTTSLLCSSQTIADHYIAQYATDTPQQKPQISPSDIILAYKMMHKSHGQP